MSGLDLDGAGVVVTGAASGIGLGLATRFAAEGARVVAVDRDAERLAAVAPPGVMTLVADVGSRESVHALVADATTRLGVIDLFCANAGIPTQGGVEPHDLADDAAWQRTWDVNVMSHVWTAQALVPAWLERGSGRLLVTASAAGLLTMIGSAPYAVTKHAAVAFAEWLRATYAHRGVVVQALCPRACGRRCSTARGPWAGRCWRRTRSTSTTWSGRCSSRCRTSASSCSRTRRWRPTCATRLTTWTGGWTP